MSSWAWSLLLLLLIQKRRLLAGEAVFWVWVASEYVIWNGWWKSKLRGARWRIVVSVLLLLPVLLIEEEDEPVINACRLLGDNKGRLRRGGDRYTWDVVGGTAGSGDKESEGKANNDNVVVVSATTSSSSSVTISAYW